MRFLMCEPRHFAVNYEINPWMGPNIGRADPVVAHAQWDALADQLVRAGATLDVMTSQPPDLPDLVFTANAAAVIGRRAFLSWFAKLERQPEHVLYGGALRKAGFEVDTRFVEARLPFEGAGDALQLHGGGLVIGWGFRTDLAAVDVLVDAVPGTPAVPAHLCNPHFYHLDTCFCPLPDGSALWYPEAFTPDARAMLTEQFGPSRGIAVTVDEANEFACNAVEVGGRVFAHRWSGRLRRLLAARGFEAIATDLSEFMRAGGSAKCLTLRLD
jgi:N-dimethylarginine dimethylaminohydrolase